MSKYGPSVFFLAVLAIATMLACGSPPSPPRILKSVSLSPAVADAQGSPIQFTATGRYGSTDVSVAFRRWVEGATRLHSRQPRA